MSAFDSTSIDEKDENGGSTPGTDNMSRDLSTNSLLENGIENPKLEDLANLKAPSDLSIFSDGDISSMPTCSNLIAGTPDSSADAITPSDDDTFCLIDSSSIQSNCLYLFARADRQKEDWYRRLVAAMRIVPPSPEEQLTQLESVVALASKPELEVFIPESSFDTASLPGVEFVRSSARETATDGYIEFMNRFHLQMPRTVVPKQVEAMNLDREVECDVMWINAIAGHVLYDVLRNDHWREVIRLKIQKKLEMIKLPYFMETLILSDVDLGKDVPMIHRASRPVLDNRGLWVDLDITFEGHVCMTLETKLNLMKLKTPTTPTPTPAAAAPVPADQEEEPGTSSAINTSEKCKSPIYDSEVEDTAETSESEEDKSKTSSESGGKSVESSPSKKPLTSSGKGVIRMMNKIVASKYFQQATENKYIKRAMEGVSNTTITLVVEIRGLTGELVLNLPPPPSDRLWYGFRGNPKIWIKASPKFGDRHLNIKHVVSWIEKKLIQEFQKKFVLPNMDDLVISPMTTRLPD